MQRVETLLQKLQQQFKDGAKPAQLLLTAQMLQHELAHLQQADTTNNKELVIVSMPLQMLATETPAIAEKPAEEEKIIQILQVDEEEIEAELEEIKRNAAAMNKIGVQSRPQLLFDPIEDDEEIPTLAHHRENRRSTVKEINESVANNGAGSLNERFKEVKTELSEKLHEVSIKDLKKAIGVNDRFLYINELFRGDEAMYERSIKTINSFSILPEAEYWIRRELKVKLGWVDSHETVKQFDILVKRRFG